MLKCLSKRVDTCIGVWGFVVLIGATPSLAGPALVVNPSFESYSVVASGVVALEEPVGVFTTVVDLDGWEETLGGFSLERYDGNFAPVTGTPPAAGLRLLYGSTTAQSRLRQSIDLAFAGAQIGADSARYLCSASLGSYHGGNFPETQQDVATIALRFLDDDAGGALLREDLLVGPSRPSDVGIPTNFDGRNFAAIVSREGIIPVGTDRLEMLVILTRDADAQSGSFNNANVDRIDFQIVPPGCLGDANNDGLIDGRDVSVLLAQFGASVESGSGADFNGDGGVDGRDLSVLLANFGNQC